MLPNATLGIDVDVSELTSDAVLLVRKFANEVDPVEISLVD